MDNSLSCTGEFAWDFFYLFFFFYLILCSTCSLSVSLLLASFRVLHSDFSLANSSFNCSTSPDKTIIHSFIQLFNSHWVTWQCSHLDLHHVGFCILSLRIIHVNRFDHQSDQTRGPRCILAGYYTTINRSLSVNHIGQPVLWCMCTICFMLPYRNRRKSA